MCVKDLAGMESQHDPVTVDCAVIGGNSVSKHVGYANSSSALLLERDFHLVRFLFYSVLVVRKVEIYRSPKWRPISKIYQERAWLTSSNTY